MLFHKASQVVFDWIEKQTNVKEESLTDWLLYDLSTRTSRLQYHAFTRNVESLNGADWDWWILTDTCAYRFRVQAKKLSSSTDNYPSICYSNQHGLQIDLLIESSRDSDSFPLYLFYSCVEQNTPYVLEAYTNEALIDMIHWCETCTNGVFIAPAKYIYTSILDHPRVHISASRILNISLKLSMFDMFMRTDGPNLINTQVEEALNYLNQFCENTLEYSIRYEYGSSLRRIDYKTVPKWLDILIGNSSTSKGMPEWYEREFMRQLPNTSGIASLDLRQNPNISICE